MPTAHIYVTIFFQTKICLTKLLVLVLFFSCFLFKLLLNTGEIIYLSFWYWNIYD